MVGADGTPALPWLAQPLRRALQTQRAHAVLLHGPQGVGQFELALGLAQGWLCEMTAQGGGEHRPCGTCAACRLVLAHSHPDLLVLLPEVLRESLGWSWPDAESDEGASDKAGKAKPSKEVKVDALRRAVAFAQTTSARGRAKVVVIHPAERMNSVSANTLLKTLEEPPGGARFVLSCGAPDALLPTIRSRCQALTLALPPRDMAIQWLDQCGVPRPEVMLAAAGGRPLEARDWAQQGVDAALWAGLPQMIARGETGHLADWPPARLVDALQKLCHDALCRACGAPTRYFSADSVSQGASLRALCDWARELQRCASHIEHPWNAGLMAESLVLQGRMALATGHAPSAQRRGDSLHSRA